MAFNPDLVLTGSDSGPSGRGGAMAILGALVGPLIGTATKMLQQVRRRHIQPRPPDLAEQIAAADTAEKAAAALVELARRYEWSKLLPELRKQGGWLSNSSGLQRDLMMLLRDAVADPIALEGLTANFVNQLLQSHRVPLSTLTRTMADLELGGWVTVGVRDWVQRTVRKPVLPKSTG